MTQVAKRRIGRIARKSAPRGMDEGLVWVEVYLPFDPDAFRSFMALTAKHGSAAAAAALDPELASKALDPIDSEGEAMMAPDLQQLAHGYLAGSRKVDVMHDEAAIETVQIVESFRNTEEVGSPHFAAGAWVVVLKVDKGSEEWRRIEANELDAVSFMAWTTKIPVATTPEAA